MPVLMFERKVIRCENMPGQKGEVHSQPRNDWSYNPAGDKTVRDIEGWILGWQSRTIEDSK
jgi:hypothetical protein